MPPGSERLFAAAGVPLRATLCADGSTARIALTGELDHVSTALLRQALDAAAKVAPGDVVVDLAALTFCDAGAVGCFVEWAGRLGEADRRLRVVDPVAAVARVLRIVRAEFLLD